MPLKIIRKYLIRLAISKNIDNIKVRGSAKCRAFLYLKYKMKLDWKTIQSSIMQLIDEYKFDPHQILDIVKMWIKSAFKKDYMPTDKKSVLHVNIDKDGNIKIFREFEISEEIEDDSRQMNLEEAKTHRKDVQLGETILIDITPSSLEFSRIAVQAAAQTIKQSLKKIERERFFDKFQDKQWELLKARVIKVNADNVLLDIDGTSVVLPQEGQISNRVYNIWEEIYVLLRQISKWAGGIVLDITQSAPEFIETMLDKNIAEISQGIVVIEKIVRIAGKRTKILVSTKDERVDPVWVFVGQYGQRITSLVDMLEGEKIDFIEYHEDPAVLVASCLKPARVNHVEIKWRKAFVKVDEDQKALAIWKGAVNIKLASQLSWHIIELE